jgi:hypothetical protein
MALLELMCQAEIKVVCDLSGICVSHEVHYEDTRQLTDGCLVDTIVSRIAIITIDSFPCLTAEESV